jgi:hypothetical protein
LHQFSQEASNWDRFEKIIALSGIALYADAEQRESIRKNIMTEFEKILLSETWATLYAQACMATIVSPEIQFEIVNNIIDQAPKFNTMRSQLVRKTIGAANREQINLLLPHAGEMDAELCRLTTKRLIAISARDLKAWHESLPNAYLRSIAAALIADSTDERGDRSQWASRAAKEAETIDDEDAVGRGCHTDHVEIWGLPSKPNF